MPADLTRDGVHHPAPAPPRFDPQLGAWILTRFADVATALRHPSLVVGDAGAADAHAVRQSGFELPVRLVQEHAPQARARVAALPAGATIDLLEAFARPWCLELALRMAGAPPEEGARLDTLAREMFLAAARATSGATESHALGAAQDLAHRLAGSGPLGVQSFVALSQTLPGFLAAAWLALLDHPSELARLRRDPELLPRAIEELLRYSGPSRAVFRHAAAPLVIGGERFVTGDRVILSLGAANRDPTRFADPDRLDLGRGASGHLAFGWGMHACLGAQLVRVAATVATAALLDGTSEITRVGEVSWLGGYAIRVPASLPVVLQRGNG